MFPTISRSLEHVHIGLFQYMVLDLLGIRDALKRFQRPIAAWPAELEWMTTDDKKKPKGTFQNYHATTTCCADDIAFLQYTSGSTSEPKGVMITHGNLSHNLTIITNELGAVDDTIVVSWLPQYHDMGLIGSYLGVIYCGGSGYYMSPLSFLQRPMLWIEAVSAYQATHLQAPNFAFKLTARKFKAAEYANNPLKLDCVRHVINAAEPVDEQSIQAFEKAFGPFGLGKVIFPTYGLAEHTVFVCSGGTQRLSVLKKELEVDKTVILLSKSQGSTRTAISRLVGCGYPARQGVELKIVDRETCQELESDKVGEIWIRSLSKAAGYFQKELETAEDFQAKLDGTTDGTIMDGFLRTGDLGFLHQEELFICGRLKDLIIIAGRNYYPQDLEATAEATSNLLRPGCSAAFTIDPTKQGNEEVALVMELREVPAGGEVENICHQLADQVRAAINQEHSLGLAEIVFLRTKTVPKTTSGKIARSWCRKGFLGGSLKIVYRKSFKDSTSTFEIEQFQDAASQAPLSQDKVEELRAMDKEDILMKLRKEVSKVGSLPPETIDKDAPLITILDSLSISQFKGLIESGYVVKLSDEYLFRETTTLTKLVEVVKLGYAPDDTEGGEGQNGGAPGASAVSTQRTAGGIAGALGCPPGVVCCVIQ
jgi:acyl-CoA synthetase (AMP-forming)/AMP-acid ligase II/acyl carrier protein